MAVQFISPAQKTVALAGTAEALSATIIRTPGLVIQALVDNTGNVFVGDSTIADGRGVELSPGQTVEFSPGRRRSGSEELDLADIYIDVAVNGEGVSYIYEARKP